MNILKNIYARHSADILCWLFTLGFVMFALWMCGAAEPAL